MLGDYDRGLRYFDQAFDSSTEAEIKPDLEKIEKALKDREETDLGPYHIPLSNMFRPQEDNVKAAEKKDYLGKSVVVAGSDSKDDFAGFSGRLQKVNYC
jgi:hypothetical protein